MSALMMRPPEAAVVAGVETSDVHRLIDRRVLPDGLLERGQERLVSEAACSLIAFYFGSAARLTAEERLSTIRKASPRLSTRSLSSFAAASEEEWVMRDDVLSINLRPFIDGVVDRWRRLQAAKAIISSQSDVLGGAPVIRGTRIPAHDVAASLAAGQSRDRILAAYPALTIEAVDAAALYAKAYPQQGRPRAPMAGDGLTPSFERRIARRRSTA